MSAVKAHEVLEKLDQKTFGFFHIKMIVVRPSPSCNVDLFCHCQFLIAKCLPHHTDIRNGILH